MRATNPMITGGKINAKKILSRLVAFRVHSIHKPDSANQLTFNRWVSAKQLIKSRLTDFLLFFLVSDGLAKLRLKCFHVLMRVGVCQSLSHSCKSWLLIFISIEHASKIKGLIRLTIT